MHGVHKVAWGTVRVSSVSITKVVLTLMIVFDWWRTVL